MAEVVIAFEASVMGGLINLARLASSTMTYLELMTMHHEMLHCCQEVRVRMWVVYSLYSVGHRVGVTCAYTGVNIMEPLMARHEDTLWLHTSWPSSCLLCSTTSGRSDTV